MGEQAVARRSELLMPAGSLEKMKIAVLYGADAVYMGTPDMSLRTKSAFTLEDVVEGIEYAHERGKRVYLTLNLFSHNKDIAKLPAYIETVRKVQPDGLIVADPGVFMMVKEMAPELNLHISTQANVCSWLSVQFWEKQGAELVVMAREVSFEELTEIREKCPDVKLEAFVHGSMCMTYSGRCLLSNFMSERGANQGSCTNSCRWNYTVKVQQKDGTVKEVPITDENKDQYDFYLEEENRPGELMEIQEDERGSYILNSKDLCLLPVLDDYLRIGVDSLKVEGRGKSPYYVAMVARAYRQAIDDYYEDPENWKADKYMRELMKVPNRGYTMAFHEGRLTNHAHNYENTNGIADWEYAARVLEVRDDAFILEVKNRIQAGDVLEFVSPQTGYSTLLRMYEFENIKNGKVTEEIHAGQKPLLRVPFSLFDREEQGKLGDLFPEYTVIRKERPLSEEQWARIKLDKEASRIEQGKGGSAERYTRHLDALQATIAEALPEQHFNAPRNGVNGCCGRGCNGCLQFWHDDKYAKAREVIEKKKQGEMLALADAKALVS